MSENTDVLTALFDCSSLEELLRDARKSLVDLQKCEDHPVDSMQKNAAALAVAAFPPASAAARPSAVSDGEMFEQIQGEPLPTPSNQELIAELDENLRFLQESLSTSVGSADLRNTMRELQQWLKRIKDNFDQAPAKAAFLQMRHGLAETRQLALRRLGKR